jgi:hypothetical protein
LIRCADMQGPHAYIATAGRLFRSIMPTATAESVGSLHQLHVRVVAVTVSAPR